MGFGARAAGGFSGVGEPAPGGPAGAARVRWACSRARAISTMAVSEAPVRVRSACRCSCAWAESRKDFGCFMGLAPVLGCSAFCTTRRIASPVQAVKGQRLYRRCIAIVVLFAVRRLVSNLASKSSKTAPGLGMLLTRAAQAASPHGLGRSPSRPNRACSGRGFAAPLTLALGV